MALRDRLRTQYDQHPLFVILAALLVALHLAYPLVDWWLRAADIAPPFSFWDFGAYNQAVDAWKTDGHIYTRNEDGGYHGSYLYPPIVLVLFRPFAALGRGVGDPLWVASSLLLLWGGMVLVVERLVGRRSWPERLLLLWLLVGYQPLLLAMKMGQTAAFMTGVLCFAFVGLDRGMESRAARVASGALTGVVGIVKFAYAPVGTHLLANRDRFVGAVLTGLGLIGLSLLLFGVEVHRTYIEVLAWGFNRSGPARSPALWLAPYFKPLGWLASSLWIRLPAVLLVVLVALLARDRDRETFALGLAVFPLLTTLAYTYYLVALLPAAAILIHGELERGGRPVVPTLGLGLAGIHSYGLLAITTAVPAVVPALDHALVYFLAQPATWGCLLLAGTAFVRTSEGIERPLLG
ncbi:MAG: glycosyltransferase family 87 protein [Halobacteriales archaeon]|nr:glycosyltransferase family 87 protein [Halobacteriales archaeon]